MAGCGIDLSQEWWSDKSINTYTMLLMLEIYPCVETFPNITARYPLPYITAEQTLDDSTISTTAKASSAQRIETADPWSEILARLINLREHLEE